jgi:hypothetical protein
MFVWQSKYENMRRRAISAELNLYYLQDKWNKLVKQINEKGGARFLKEANIKSDIFTDTDITKLIQLCHPDKHDGKPIANEMTQKLLKLKEKMK